MKKIAVILSGCGNKDGAEITEAVSTLVNLSEQGVQYKIFAPNHEFEAINFLTGEKHTEIRNVLYESARIARSEISDVKELKVADFDGLVLPGGFGAALHLCTFAKHGSKGEALPEIKRVIEEFYQDSKPICAICIAPALVSLVLGKNNITITLGRDAEAAQEIRKTGAQHEVCPPDDFITDRENKIITTPAYMYDEATPSQVFTGIRGAIRELVEMS